MEQGCHWNFRVNLSCIFFFGGGGGAGSLFVVLTESSFLKYGFKDISPILPRAQVFKLGDNKIIIIIIIIIIIL